MTIAGPHLADDRLAPPVSFKTAPEDPVSSPASTPKMNGTKQFQNIDRAAPVTAKSAKQLPHPPKTPRRKIIEQSNRCLTASNLSMSRSTREEHQQARGSIGQSRRSLTSGLSQLGSPGRNSGL